MAGRWSASSKRKWLKHIAAGLCAKCGQQPPRTEALQCQACLDKIRTRTRRRKLIKGDLILRLARERRQHRAKLGLCTDCGNSPPSENRKRCDGCLVNSRKKDKRRYVHRKKPTPKWMQSFKREWRARRRASGVCTTCGGMRNIIGYVRCSDCLVEGREAYRRNPHTRIIYIHRRRARKHKNGGTFSVQQWRVIRELQDFTCLACGLKEPDIRLTVDHVLPVALKGRNSPENIQGLCESCNKSKNAKHIDYRSESLKESISHC